MGKAAIIKWNFSKKYSQHSIPCKRKDVKDCSKFFAWNYRGTWMIKHNYDFNSFVTQMRQHMNHIYMYIHI